MSEEAVSVFSTARLAVIKRPALKDLVITEIREAIMAGDLKPGERLTESGLAKKLRVSQATVREALIELENLGFVERPAPRRTCVTVQTRRDTEEIYAIRLPLEKLVIDFLANNRSVNLDDAETACQRMLEAAHSGNVAEFLVADLAFHQALWKAAKNLHLEEIIERLVGRGFAFSLITVRQRRPATDKLKTIGLLHVQLLQLILKGEIEQAKMTLEASMDRTWMEEVNLTDAKPALRRVGSLRKTTFTS
jgi:DNA-binding GntR family transcriptional regulator